MDVGFRMLFIFPFLPWLLSIFFAMRLFKTQKHQVVLISPDDVKRFYVRTVSHKQQQLNWSFAFLVAGIILMIAVLVVRYSLYETTVEDVIKAVIV